MNQVLMTCIQTITIAPRCISQKGSNPDGVTKRLGAINAPRSLSVKRATAWGIALVLCLIHVAHGATRRDPNAAILNFERPFPTVVLTQDDGSTTGELPIKQIHLIKGMTSTGSILEKGGRAKEYSYTVHLDLAPATTRTKKQHKASALAFVNDFDNGWPLKLRINKENFGALAEKGHARFFTKLLGKEALKKARRHTQDINYINLRFNLLSGDRVAKSRLNIKWTETTHVRRLTLTTHLVDIDELHVKKEKPGQLKDVTSCHSMANDTGKSLRDLALDLLDDQHHTKVGKLMKENSGIDRLIKGNTARNAVGDVLELAEEIRSQVEPQPERQGPHETIEGSPRSPGASGDHEEPIQNATPDR